MLVPPQALKYHFQVEPEPSLPPLTFNVDDPPRQIVDDPKMEVAVIDESLITVDLNAQTPGQFVPVAVRYMPCVAIPSCADVNEIESP
jgi:hypothetical protein